MASDNISNGLNVFRNLTSSMAIPSVAKLPTQDSDKYEPTLQSSSPSNEEPYSHFTKPQKRFIVTLIAATGLFSPLSSFIYFPDITSLASSLNVSME